MARIFQTALLVRALGASAGGGRLVNKLSGKCLDVKGTPGTGNFAKLQIWDCEYSRGTDQIWELASNGQIRNLHPSNQGKCLELEEMEPTNNGARAQLWKCHLEGDFRWTLDQRGFLRNHLGKCLDLKGTPARENGAMVQSWDCEEGYAPDSTDQLWEFREVEMPAPPTAPAATAAPAAGGGYLVNKLSGKCLDVKGTPGTGNFAKLQIWDCEYSRGTDQIWELASNGQIRNLHPSNQGKCLDLEYTEPTNNGARAQLWDCLLERDFLWTLDQRGFLRNRLGKCLDVQGAPARENGAMVQSWDCEEGYAPDSTDQLWEFREVELPVTTAAPAPPTSPATTTAPAAGGGRLVNKLSGKCLDVKGTPGIGNFAKLQIWDCEYSRGTDQIWELASNGQIRNIHPSNQGKCLDLEYTEPTNNGARAQLWDCLLERDFLWMLDQRGFLRNQLGKCLDVQGTPARENGAMVQSWDCEEGYAPDSTDQLWEFRETASNFA